MKSVASVVLRSGRIDPPLTPPCEGGGLVLPTKMENLSTRRMATVVSRKIPTVLVRMTVANVSLMTVLVAMTASLMESASSTVTARTVASNLVAKSVTRSRNVASVLGNRPTKSANSAVNASVLAVFRQ